MCIKVNLNIPNLNKKFEGSVVLISGFIISIWSITIFIVGIIQRDRSVNTSSILIVTSSIITHLLIVGATNYALLTAFRKNDAIYLKPWILYKIFECILMFIGSILIKTNSYYYYHVPYVGLMPVGFLLTAIGCYITYCVWKTYKEMALPTIETPNITIENQIPDKPPSYDTLSSETNVN